ncbi:hypothetical protein IAQ61_005304 [Plenodomus lingam]|uniref:Uncharacterized protein n=1 Tax=Leptosphaeria maculans (strain JN3 / isolate v23.1.3 / race Av1-4-5-6-7-8) TaxID=985895 RepID=E5A743_LEPMJ|nr:predicted protein [Plenodomus lingam JN3]KAH9872468.1 hypothetical protein IAQ61_005304 [Plenodomus lingam]CBX99438.1 predicted protein [Plenodomus lingam JN3]
MSLVVVPNAELLPCGASDVQGSLQARETGAVFHFDRDHSQNWIPGNNVPKTKFFLEFEVSYSYLLDTDLKK